MQSDTYKLVTTGYIKIKFPDKSKVYVARLGNRRSHVPHKTATLAKKYSIRWKKTAERFLK